MRYLKFTCLALACCFLLNCNSNNNSAKTYLADIGDTTFNSSIDKSSFNFCDSSNVLHKRAYVKYEGGIRSLENDLIAQYQIKPGYKDFSGYFIVRFAVNCKDEIGRFRWEVVNPDFEETTCPEELENNIITIFKRLDKWNHPFYRGADYDGYTYVVIKLKNGQIIPS